VSGAAPSEDDLTQSLILVDNHDQEIGYQSKKACHEGAGLLHRAFSVFLFNADGNLLLQQRSEAKPLWPLHWSNTCCSHPRRGESVEAAARRRVREELGVCCDPVYLYKFIYHASFGSVGSEHEYCWVLAGHYSGELEIDRNEITNWRCVRPDMLTAEIAANADAFTPWLKLEWPRVSAEFLGQILPTPA
jgi:isopentenyl-diphosphate delta-isomerase